jgi:hypothetical protein
MSRLFQFESDFAQSLNCIPMQVRLNLDTCGIKLKLSQWNRLPDCDRQALLESLCTTPSEIQAYRQNLQALVMQYTGERTSELPIDLAPPWLNPDVIPDSVKAKATEFGVTLSPSQWQTLSAIQRFALIKLSRSNHENHNFLPALNEFSISSL